MHRRQLLTVAASSAAVAAAGCTGSGDEPTDESDDPDDTNPNESDDTPQNGSDPEESPDDDPVAELTNGSFEDDLNEWTVGTDLPEEPGDSTEKVGHGAEVVTKNASEGSASVEFFLDGSADDGTIWVAQRADLSSTDAVLVDVYNDEKSFNILTQVAFYAGEKPSGELVEVDFNRENSIEGHSGWKTFRYDVSDIDGEATVAVGMNIIWETGVRHVFDNVRLEAAEE